MSTDARPFEGYEGWELDMIAAGDWPDPVTSSLLAYARSASNCRRELRLRAALYRIGCPPTLDLAEHSLGLLSTGRASEVQRHLADCPHCSAELESLRRSARAARPYIERARAVVRTLVLELTELISPAAPRFALKGLRGVLWSATYQSDGYTLSLMKQRNEERFEIVGGLLGARDEGGEVRLHQGDTLIAQSPLSLAATFTLAQPPPGEYELFIVTGTDELHIPRIVLTD